MRGWLVALLLLSASPAFAAETTPDAYGPAFCTLGTDTAQAHFTPGPQVVVNRFGGNLMAQSTDVDLPSVGGFALRFVRTHNSGGAQDNSYGRARRQQGPLGQGWTAHYGLVVLHPDSGPTWHTGTGTRRHFYRHDTLSALQVQASRPIVRQWVDDALHVLAEHADHTLTLFAPDGRRTLFAWIRNDGREGHYVAQEIADDAGNKWALTYERDWWHDYPLHPVVRTLQDEEGRTLNFLYQKIAAHPRLTKIDLDGKALAFYDYRSAPDGAYLIAHKTPEGRRTVYTYHATEPQVGALSGLTLPTGGQYAFDYQERAFFFPGRKLQNLVVETLRRGHDTWRFFYPTETGSSNTFEVRTQGPHGYSASHVYHSYAQGHCSGTKLWRVGKLASTTTSVDNSASKETFSFEPLQISSASLAGPCPYEPAAAARTVQRTELRDGHTQVVNYGGFSYLAPSEVTGPGNRREHNSYYNLIRADLYRLAAPATHTVEVGGDVVEKFAFGPYNTYARPSEVKLYRTAQSAISVALSYHGHAGKRGAVASKRYGGYSECFDYSFGQLSKHSFPEGADDIRTVARDGSIREQTQDGITTSYAYDQDGRVLRVTPPLDAATTLSYRSNEVAIRQGPRQVRHDYDAWGQLTQTSSSTDTGTQTVHFSYDGLGRRVREISPLGLRTDFVYDVYGRLKRATSTLLQVEYSYRTSANDTQVTRVENGSVSHVQVKDLAGRPVRDALNNQEVRTDYHGGHQTLRAGGKTVVRTVDLFGNLVAEQRPEFVGTSHYHYDARGWLTHADLPSGTVHYRRDGRGRVTEERSADGSRRNFRYHARYGQLVTAATAEAERSMELDAQGRVRVLTQTVRSLALAQARDCPRGSDASQPLRFATSLTYDELGRLNSFEHPHGGVIQQVQFGPGLAAEVKNVTLGRQDVVRNVAYGPVGTRTRASLLGGPQTIQYHASYDALGRPTAWGYTGAAHFNVDQVSYDDAGYITRETQHSPEGVTALSYGYGQQGELTGYHRSGIFAGDLRYIYDAHGNLVGRQATGHEALQPHTLQTRYDAADHRAGASYDRAGRLVAEGAWAYAYDGFDRLVAATSPAAELTYASDAAGSRVRTSTAKWASYAFRLPDGRLIEEVRFVPDAAGCLQREVTDYAYLGRYPVAAQVQRSDGNISRRAELRSPSGTLVGLLDDRGDPGATYPKFGPFGEALDLQDVGSRHLFAGHVRDASTGLDDLLARNYASGAGQFTTPDPVRLGAADFPFALNLYAYARNNPVAFADPDGLDWVTNEFGEKVWEGSDGVVAVPFPWEYVQAGRAIGAFLTGAARLGLRAGVQSFAVGAQKSPPQSCRQQAEAFFHNTSISRHVRQNAGKQDFHDFPKQVQNYAGDGKVFLQKGADGRMYEHLRISGGLRHRDGTFEFIKNPDGELTHQLFRPAKSPK